MKANFALIVGLVLLTAITVGIQAQQAPTYWPTDGWHTSTPESQGFDSAKAADMLLAMREQNINIHSLLVIRNGEMVLDSYFYPYDGSTVHDIASVTKSVMTTLIGIAVDQGSLSLDDPILQFFPDHTVANLDPLKERITVRNLVGMTSGLDCDKEGGGEPENDAMHTTPDWVQFTLDLDMASEPGTRFAYCSPGMHLLSAILQQATGMTTEDFARENLFEPLGIHEVIWPTDPQGLNTGSGDLKLHPHDMAKLGYLWLNHGIWEGQQIVSREWVESSVMPQIETGEGGYYGYGWWVETEGIPSYRADGRGGQYILAVPSMNLIVVTTGGGFTLDQIDPLLLAALADADEALPPNPDGMAQLAEALATVSQPPPVMAVAPLPETASLISGQTFVVEPNPLEIETIGLEFIDYAEADLHVTPSGSDETLSLPIALDGVYRLFPGDYDLPQGLRGSWTDDHTFALEYDEIANNTHLMIQMHFERDQVTVTFQGISSAGSGQFEGTLQTP